LKAFQLTRETILPRPLEEVFPFFAEARNLERITPPWLHFKILSDLPIEMKAGATIRYRLRLRGVPLRWTSRISVWEPPCRFVDEQISGPYRLWVHGHTFEGRRDSTAARDHVRYIPRGGGLVHRLFVRPHLERIFDYREQRLQELLWEGKPPGEFCLNSEV
jgi:ligand-binding SRPBCC domain-containing protein